MCFPAFLSPSSISHSWAGPSFSSVSLSHAVVLVVQSIRRSLNTQRKSGLWIKEAQGSWKHLLKRKGSELGRGSLTWVAAWSAGREALRGLAPAPWESRLWPIRHVHLGQGIGDWRHWNCIFTFLDWDYFLFLVSYLSVTVPASSFFSGV